MDFRVEVTSKKGHMTFLEGTFVYYTETNNQQETEWR